ncbi:glycosyltransferase family 2 protein [Pontibacter saemangeumensis]|uniref:Glycosyltransferase family 2 protein n=1 Tax=Pontibacter saemangeumensis TaxID=1084525 RepID=A0ABP8LXH2_9BACT
MSPALDLTIAIPVKNEEKNLSRCLAAIGTDLARHVVVIDSNSTDSTREIAKNFKTEIVNFVWDGKFPKKRNWFLRNHTPETKWVMFLDADEYVTEDFKKELRERLSCDDDKVGYWLNFTVYFLGKKMKGGYPLRKLALFQVGAGEYEQVDETEWSTLDMEVHEHPMLQGSTGSIKSKIEHQDFRCMSHYIRKHNEYASWEAARFLNSLKEPTASSQWTWKQRIKYGLFRSIFVGPAFFFGSYFFLGGFRDGAHGFAVAVLKMSYFMQVYCQIREKK